MDSERKVDIRAFDRKIIYVYRHLDVASHVGWLKIGETYASRITGDGKNLRILEQNTAANVAYEVLYMTDAVTNAGEVFSDHDIHDLLVAKDIEREDTINPNTQRKSEWFKTDLETVVNTIEEYKMQAVRDVHDVITDFVLRDEQRQAIEMTTAYYNSLAETGAEPSFLWNAKPRFGKTLTSYCFAAEIQAKKVLIVTHRPAIADSWYTDFRKFDFREAGQNDGKFRWIFTCSDAVKKRLANADDAYTREEQLANPNLLASNMIHFVSLQDIKGRQADDFKEKNRWIFDLDWDLVIIDESHEGVDTHKAMRMFDAVNTKFVLHLSGTPFKAIVSNRFSAQQIFNWSYTDEQFAKNNWPIEDTPNPYAELPQMHIMTYQLSRALELTAAEARDEGSEYAFELTEFFRVGSVDGKERFVHEEQVRRFVRNLHNPNYQYPFSTAEYRESLRHTFWLLPGVKACEQMKRILLEDDYFGREYAAEDIIMAAGNGDADRLTDTALAEVRRRIGEPGSARHPLETRTITLSCGQLTTGVTVPAWTAVIMLNGCKSPSLYMQSAFRAQNPFSVATSGDECFTKEHCYVFDFAPDRILQTLAEIADSGVSNTPTRTHEEKIKILINFLPVIAEDDEGKMKYLDASEVLTIPLDLVSDEIVSRGFMSNRLFKNIGNIFGCPQDITNIISKLDEGGAGTSVNRDPRTKPALKTKPRVWVDDAQKIHINEDIVISSTEGLLGEKRYVTISSDEGKEVSAIIAEATAQARAAGYNNVAVKSVQKALEQKLPKLVTKLSDPEPQPGDPEYHEIEEPDRKPAPKEKTDEEIVRDRLRGFARTIPSLLMAYGTADTTLANYGDNIPDDVFLELTNITKEEFRKLRDGMDYVRKNEQGEEEMAHFDGLINEDYFNASVRKFEQKKAELARYYSAETQGDIFECIPPQANNQIFTPHRVVAMMVDLLEAEDPKIFQSTTNRFIDPYMKSGMYITEIVKRIFKATRDQYASDDECIKHILEEQVYGFAPTKILDAITRNYIFGFDKDGLISQRNFLQYDAAVSAHNKTLIQEVNRLFSRGGPMKFKAVIGNPPFDYEAGRRKIPLYQDFLMLGSDENFTDLACFISPDGFVKGGQQLEPLRNHLIETKHLKKVEFHRDTVFPGFAVDAAITLFDNTQTQEVPEKTIVFANGETESGVLNWQYRDVIIDDNKYAILHVFERIVENLGKDAETMADLVTSWAPFGLNTKSYKNNREKFLTKKDDRHDTRILVGEEQDFYWIDPSDDFSYEGSNGRVQCIDSPDKLKWKMVFPKAGTVDAKPLKTRILQPGEIFTDKYLCVYADSEKEAKHIEKYFNSKFYRAGLDSKATSWNLYKNWHGNIPAPDFTDDSEIDWNKSGDELDRQLYRHYGITDEEVALIEARIK